MRPSRKERHREIGNWLARRVARPSAVYGTWLAVRLGLSAHQVTLAALAASLGGAVAIGTGSRAGFVLGVALAHLGFWLDHVDGQVARWRGTASLDGVYFDYLMHHVVNLAAGIRARLWPGLPDGRPAWAVAGFAIAAGWALLACTTTAATRPSSSASRAQPAAYAVDGGSGGRPSPPASWPRRGAGRPDLAGVQGVRAACRLDGLTGLAVVAGVRPVALAGLLAVASLSWRCWPLLLGAARIARP